MTGRAASGCTLFVDIDRGCKLHITVEVRLFLIISYHQINVTPAFEVDKLLT